MISDNIAKVENTIQEHCMKVGRDSREITLITVSKTKPVPMLQEAYDAGSRDFGENRVQELVDKYDKLPDDIRWHQIGHLQTNKVKYIVDKVYMIHSVESLRLAQEISKEAVKKKVTVKVLVEVNIGNEDSKFGLPKEAVIPFLKEINELPGIHVEGLMAIAPICENPEENRTYFQQMKQLSVDIIRENIDNVNMNVLSMGMTGDYQIAVEEGATYVRVGTGIFGER